MGEPLPNVELLFGFDRQVRVTGGDGSIRIPSVPARFQQTRVRTPPITPPPTGDPAAQALDSLRAAVKPRWDQARPGPWYEPVPDDVVVQLHGDIPIDISLLSERPRTIVVRPWVIRVRLIGGYFDADKCFLLPSAVKASTGGDSDMRRVRQHLADNPDSALLIVGHTDTTGDPAYNDALSLERADSVAAYLRHDVEAWLGWYYSDHAPDKCWRMLEDHFMISVTPDYARRQPLESPVHWYQRTHGIPATGVAGPDTRASLIADYMQLAGARLTATTRVITQGCGGRFPLHERPNESGRATPDLSGQADKRIEIYLFDRTLGIQPIVPGENAPPPPQVYPEWDRRTALTYQYWAGPTTRLDCRITVQLRSNSGRLVLCNRSYRLQLNGGVVKGMTTEQGHIDIEAVSPGEYPLSVDAGVAYVSAVPPDCPRQLQRVADARPITFAADPEDVEAVP